MKLLANLTLGKKILFLTVLGLVLEIGIFSFLGLRAVNQATEAMLEDRMTTAHLVADYMDENLNNALTELQDTAEIIENLDATDIRDLHVRHLEEIYQHLSLSIYGIYLADSNGNIIWSKSEAAANNTGTELPQWIVSDIIQGSQQAVSSIISAPVTGTPIILLNSISSNKQNEGRALIVAVDLAQSGIAGFVQPIRLGETGYVEIVDNNGIVIARTNPGAEPAPFEKSDHSGRFAALIEAGEPTRGLCHTCHEPVQRVITRDVLAFVPMKSTAWGVVIRQAEKEALGPIRELRWNLLFFAIGLSAITLLVAAITTRNVVGRVKMLTTASKRIASGDLSSPVSISYKDEVSILAETFEEMRIKLRQSYGELERRTTVLASLLSISEVLSHLHDVSDLDMAMGTALDETLSMIEISSGSILLLEEGRKRLLSRINRGLFADCGEILDYTIEGEDVFSTIVQTCEAVVTPDIWKESGLAQSNLLRLKDLKALIAVPLKTKENVWGILAVGSEKTREFSTEDQQLVEGVALQIAIAVENTSLHREVQNKEKIRGELLKDILTIQEEERHRIARELHDETSQVIASMTANIEASLGTLPGNAERSKELLQKARALSATVLDEIHKIIYELRPTLLDDMGLVAVIGWLMDNHLKAIGLKTKFKTIGRVRRLSPQIETTLFRAIQEAVNNISRHSEAKTAKITLSFFKDAVSAHIQDDGKGFNVEEALNSKERPRGLGLLGIKERIELIQGTSDIRSQPDGGTEIRINIPLSKEVYREQD